MIKINDLVMPEDIVRHGDRPISDLQADHAVVVVEIVGLVGVDEEGVGQGWNGIFGDAVVELVWGKAARGPAQYVERVQAARVRIRRGTVAGGQEYDAEEHQRDRGDAEATKPCGYGPAPPPGAYTLALGWVKHGLARAE